MFAEKVEGPFRGVADITVIPMQKGISQIGTWIGDVSENFETLKQLKKKIKTSEAGGSADHGKQ